VMVLAFPVLTTRLPSDKVPGVAPSECPIRFITQKLSVGVSTILSVVATFVDAK